MVPFYRGAAKRGGALIAILTGLLAMLAALPAGAAAAGNAGYTTFDATLGGCTHGSPNGINCNIYEAKQDVYINGGPTGGNGLADGEYFFAVLAPGCQNGGFLDGKPGNLSDTTAGTGGSGCSDSGTGSGDEVGNRTFTVSKGAITAYGGTHETGTDPQGAFVIALFPYDDTPNPGGVYILAICPKGATTPAPCKFDAFKVGPSVVVPPLEIVKNATPEFTREFNWSIEKSVDACQVGLATPNGCTTTHTEKTLKYTVVVSKDEGTDSGWKVSGTIEVFNPGSKEATGVVVSDVITAPEGKEAPACEIESAASPYTVGGLAGGASVELSYVCVFQAKPAYNTEYENTATVEWNPESLGTTGHEKSFTVPFEFTTPTNVVHDSVSVTDLYKIIKEPEGSATLEGTLPSGTISESKTYKYNYIVNVPHGCVKLENNATFTVTDLDEDIDDTGSAEVIARVCRVPPHTGALTMGFWQNKNGQGILKNGSSTTGVCKSGTWLRQFAPFQDLSASASCNQVAAYVEAVIKAATCGGETCNAMLKAQMLATALDVYFSDPALGTNKINAPEPIGSVTIDLTQICQSIGSGGTCNGSYEDASAAFGGSDSLTVMQMLTYAAGQSNASGSVWYGQVKATQVLAKDAFDAINNEVAFTV